MPTTNDRPLFRDGRVVLKVRAMPDGSVLMFKPFVITDAHIMNLTGAPGWDKSHVDDVFTEGVIGVLRYIYETVEYSIRIETFREHAFVRDLGHGEQYHVHKQHYKSVGLRTVNPKREDAEVAVKMPAKVEFGKWVPCTRCKSSGLEPGKKKERCTKCQGQGYEQWSSSSATC